MSFIMSTACTCNRILIYLLTLKTYSEQQNHDSSHTSYVQITFSVLFIIVI